MQRALGNNPFESVGSDMTDGYSGRIVDPVTGEDIFTANTDPTVVGNEDDGTPYPEGTDLGFAAPFRRYLQLCIHNGDFSRAPRDSSLPLMADEGSGYNPLPYWKYVPDPTGCISVIWVADSGSGSGGVLQWTATAAATASSDAYIMQKIPIISTKGRSWFDIPAAYWDTTGIGNVRGYLWGRYLKSDAVTYTGTAGFEDILIGRASGDAFLENINGGLIPADAGWLELRCGIDTPSGGAGTVALGEVARLVGVPGVYLVDLLASGGRQAARIFKSNKELWLRSSADATGASMFLSDAATKLIGLSGETSATAGSDSMTALHAVGYSASQSADILVVEKSDGTDYFRVDASGRTGVGETGALAAQFEVESQDAARVGAIVRGAGSQSADLFVVENSAGTDLWLINADGTVEQQTTGDAHTITRFANDAYGAGLNLRKSRSGTLGTNTIVTSGDRIGAISWFGGDGTDYDLAGFIAMESDGTPGSGTDMPGRFVVYTSPDGSATPAERMRVDSTGNVGIGVTPAEKLHVGGATPTAILLGPTYSSSGSENSFRVQRWTDGNIYQDYKTHASGLVYFRSGAGAESPATRTWMVLDPATGRVGIGVSSVTDANAQVELAKGIKFPATQVASTDVNTLDDYQEGTWTPVMAYVTPGTSSWAPSLQEGYYTKIGERVFWTAVYVGVPTNGTAAGQLRMSGLPFTSVNVTQSVDIGPCNMGGWTKAGYGAIVSGVIVNSTEVNFLANGSGVAAGALTVADIPTGGTVALRASGNYRAA